MLKHPHPLRRIALVSVAIVLAAASRAGAASPAPAYGENGMAVSASGWASDVGIEILKSGGNAIDASVAMGFVLAVTYPQAGNVGGGGFLVARMANGEAFTLDYRESAPAAAHREMYLDSDGNVIDGLSLRTPLASGTPGSVDGLLRAWEDHGSGKVSRRALLREAIRLAKRGFPLTRRFAEALNERREFFEADPAATAIFVRKDRPWRAGDRLVQKDLAATLTRIARYGREGFYGGDTATLVAKQMERTGGLIGLDDLRDYTPVYREPVTGAFQDLDVISMPPPSSGGVLLVQMLNMLETGNVASYGWGSSGYIHLLTEVQRRAYADRAEHLGDPDFWEVPLAMLTSPDYARKRLADFDTERATPSAEVSAGTHPPPESMETTHYSVVDKAGNAVAVTTTLNASYGSGIVVDGAGFLLNNEMDDFSAKPGVPNLYGLVGNEANAIAPGKRMLSSMTPTIITKSGKPYLVLGSPGGSTIITTVLQVLLNVAVHGMDIQEAVNASRHHSQWLPDVIAYEAFAFPADVADALTRRGHTLSDHAVVIGRADCIFVGDNGLYGAPDPRGEDVASAY